MQKQDFKVSYFNDRYSKSEAVIMLQQFITGIRGMRWQEPVAQYRALRAEGREDEAATVKGRLPGITYAGVVAGGRKATDLAQLSTVVCVDVDKYPGDIRELCNRLHVLPELLALFVSVSGKGVKVFVRVEGITKENYAECYRAVMFYIGSRIGFAADTQCTDITRLCFASHDPEAVYNPDAKPFLMPAPGVVAGWFLDVFEAAHPFVSGTRHETMLALGREAKKAGFALEEITSAAQIRFTSAGFTFGELQSCLRDGYQYVKERTDKKGFTFAPMALISDEEKYEEGEQLRENTPVFPSEIFENLPSILQRGLTVARGERERDMLLAGMLSILSGCMQGCRAVYARKNYSAHFYFFGVAGAGSGKGVVDFAHKLAVPLHDYYLKRGKEEMEQYKRLEVTWTAELRDALKEKRKPDDKMRPTEPRVPYLLVPPNSSRIRYLIHLRDNGDMGCIINTGETDALTYALGQDCGKQDDLLRNATHHEVVGSSHKSNGMPIIVPNPRIAMCLTGTPEQLYRLISSTENGLYSRFFLLTHSAIPVWRSAAPVLGEADYEDLFAGLGREVLEMSLFLKSSPTRINFTSEQWDIHTGEFSSRLSEVALEHTNSAEAVVFRHGLLVMRIAMVLTALRKWENRWHSPEMCCSDEDFSIALRLVLTALEHSMLLSTGLDTHPVKARPLTAFYRVRELFDCLPSTFTFTDFIKKGLELGYSESGVKRYLTKALKMKVVGKNDEKRYVKLVKEVVKGGK